MLTGLYPQHTGVYWRSGASFVLPAKFQLLPQMLGPAGYTSHAIGKCVQLNQQRRPAVLSPPCIAHLCVP